MTDEQTPAEDVAFEVDDASQEIEALKLEVAALKEQALRYAAEAENTKRRAEREMNDARLPGLRFYPVAFTPSSSVHAGEACEGVSIVITDRGAVRPVRFGLAIAATLRRLYPDAYDLRPAARLFGSADSLDRLIAGEAAPAIASRWTAAESRWRARRAPYLLYD